ncbi:chorismate pyruvate-lyase family protein [Trinickia sp. LjRoot230]|uniref:chorismate--pyruvate lyase family protein n=1 Tax=Trinickia sp. LjRoot230 TaxID=3342288 RepID=UPI003ECF00B6
MSTPIEQARFFSLPAAITAEDRVKHQVWNALHSPARALLCTDGTLTLLLSAFADENIETVLLSQETGIIEPASETMGLDTDEAAIRREVLIRTTEFKRNLVYAESLIAHQRLSADLRSELIEGTRPIGLLLRSARIESFRELVDWGIYPLRHAPRLQAYFDVSELLYRTYHIVVGQRPLMRITEYFPRSLFEDRHA